MDETRHKDGRSGAPRESFEHLCATSADPLVLLDRHGDIQRSGRWLAELVGRPEEALRGTSLLRLVDEEDRDAVEAALRRLRPGAPPLLPAQRPLRVRADVPRDGGEPLRAELELRPFPVDDDLLLVSLREHAPVGESLWHSLSPLLASTLDATANGIVALDRDREVVFHNRRFAEIWELPAAVRRTGDGEEIRRHQRDRLQDPDAFPTDPAEWPRERGEERRDVAELVDGRRVERCVRPREVAGRLAGWAITYRVVLDASDGRPAAPDAAAAEEPPGADVVEAQAAADVSGDRYRLLFRHNVAGVFKISLGGEILEVNQAFAEMFGYADPSRLEGGDAERLYADPDERLDFLEALRRKGSVHNYEIRALRRDGTPIWLLENSLLVDDSETGRDVVVGTVIDITQRKQLEAELERMAYHDVLTSLPNRRLLREHARQTLALADRNDGRVGLVYVDLARFKLVNDTLGHDAGDRVLKEVAHRLQRVLRESDMAARVGGDEFAVLLADVDGEPGARTAADRILSRFDEPVAVEGGEWELAARVGVALYPDHAATFDELLTRADRAMYQARTGRPKEVAVYRPDARGPRSG